MQFDGLSTKLSYLFKNVAIKNLKIARPAKYKNNNFTSLDISTKNFKYKNDFPLTNH